VVGKYTDGPCWPGDADAPPQVVYCLARPWEHNVVRVRASFSEWPAASERVARPRLWALELGDGSRCTEVYSTPSEVHGKIVRWICSEHVGLLDQPSMRRKLWTITEVTLSEYEVVKIGPRVLVKVAWYGEGTGSR
jgi:hypothetical protein